MVLNYKLQHLKIFFFYFIFINIIKKINELLCIKIKKLPGTLLSLNYVLLPVPIPHFGPSLYALILYIPGPGTQSF